MKISKMTIFLLSTSVLIIAAAILSACQYRNTEGTLFNKNQETPELSEVMGLPLQFYTEPFMETPLELQNEDRKLTALATYNLGNISQVFYIDDEDQDFAIHSYIIVNEKNYYLGKTLEQYDPNSQTSFQLVPAALTDAVEIYEWKEIVGANYIKSKFLTIDDGVPMIIAEIDGWAFHEDIDNDNQLETVATIGTAPDTTIYLWNFDGKQLLTANVNQNTHADTVTFDAESHIFALYNNGGQSTYKYENGLLLPAQ